MLWSAYPGIKMSDFILLQGCRKQLESGKARNGVISSSVQEALVQLARYLSTQLPKRTALNFRSSEITF